MTDNYMKIVQENLKTLYTNLSKELAKNLLGEQNENRFVFDAFGETCTIESTGITLGDEAHSSVLGILSSLYALNARPDICIPTPLKAFKEFPDSMSHVAASAMPTSKLLGPHVAAIKKAKQSIVKTFNGEKGPSEVGGDFSFILYPLPKIALCYIFYEADDDFSASVSCLYSNNANHFMPVSGLADVGEYTSKQILRLIDH